MSPPHFREHYSKKGKGTHPLRDTNLILYQACGDITTSSLVKSKYMISSTENLYKIYERPVVVIIITCSCSDELDENNRLPPSLADEGQHSTNHEKS